MIYTDLRFVIKYRYVFLAATVILSVIGGVYYIRSLQDKIVLAQKELEDNRIQQEALEKSLKAKGKSNAKVKTSDFNGLVSIHSNGGWLRPD